MQAILIYMIRKLSVLLCSAVTLGGLLTATATAPVVEAAPVKTRVILAPGQSVNGQSLGSFYGPMADELTRRGYPTTILDLSGKDLRADARSFAGAVQRLRHAHPRDRIALVTHSISGISARWYLKEMGGAKKVATYVSIGTAQYGSPASCTQDIARENCPGTPFMKTLNSGIDTPAPTKYFGIRSVNEYADGHLDGRQCRVTPIDLAPIPAGIDHTAEPLTPAVWNATAASLAGKCQGKWVTTPDGVLTGRKSKLPAAPFWREYKN